MQRVHGARRQIPARRANVRRPRPAVGGVVGQPLHTVHHLHRQAVRAPQCNRRVVRDRHLQGEMPRAVQCEHGCERLRVHVGGGERRRAVAELPEYGGRATDRGPDAVAGGLHPHPDARLVALPSRRPHVQRAAAPLQAVRVGLQPRRAVPGPLERVRPRADPAAGVGVRLRRLHDARVRARLLRGAGVDDGRVWRQHRRGLPGVRRQGAQPRRAADLLHLRRRLRDARAARGSGVGSRGAHPRGGGATVLPALRVGLHGAAQAGQDRKLRGARVQRRRVALSAVHRHVGVRRRRQRAACARVRGLPRQQQQQPNAALGNRSGG